VPLPTPGQPNKTKRMNGCAPSQNIRYFSR
jgi:hypothetical protein